MAVGRLGGMPLLPTPEIHIESPARDTVIPASSSFDVTGYALRSAATAGTGVSRVRLHAYPKLPTGSSYDGSDFGTPVDLGEADYGLSSPSAASYFGAQFANAGFRYRVSRGTLGDGTWALRVLSASNGGSLDDWDDTVISIGSVGIVGTTATGNDENVSYETSTDRVSRDETYGENVPSGETYDDRVSPRETYTHTEGTDDRNTGEESTPREAIGGHVKPVDEIIGDVGGWYDDDTGEGYSRDDRSQISGLQYGATISANPPNQWQPGVAQSYLVEVQNRSNFTWGINSGRNTWGDDRNASNGQSIRLHVSMSDESMYQWLPDPAALVQELVFDFPVALAPGEKISMQVTIPSPSIPGRYKLWHQMLHEDVMWFGQNSPVTITVGQVASPSSVTPSGGSGSGAPIIVIEAPADGTVIIL